MQPTDIPVTAVMAEVVTTIGPDTPLPEVFERFAAPGCTDLVVAGEDNRFLGFITALDLLAAVGPVVGVRSRKKTACLECLLRRDATAAADIMTRSHITVPAAATLREAMEAMERYRYPVLIVVDGDGVAVGRLEVCMIVAHLRVAGHL
ncbi:CBS domain-containing protein [Methanofollis sp. UBA420]|jgi:CBS domain-containing protein|uniref:CBS domain-containing protein n=1 Tax=Methanofollis sp. UBA420 TaxID=1915514 RepID=UPI00316ABCFD